MGAAAVLELSELDGLTPPRLHRRTDFHPKSWRNYGFSYKCYGCIYYLAREDRPWLQEGVFLNSVPSTLAFLTSSNVAGTAAALQAEKGQIISCTFHIRDKQGQEARGRWNPDLKKSTAGVVDVVHQDRQRWGGGGVGGRWGWRPTPAFGARWR